MASPPREVYGDLATTAFVESSHLFKSLDPEARRDLFQLARVAGYSTGETVSAESDESFFLVLEGTASAVAGGVEVAQLARGAFFGEGRVLGLGRPTALAARTEATLVAFPAPMIAAMAERFPRMKKLLEAVHAAREKDPTGRATP
jgi:signal-transduction protein with cAMP-binding, CBS, and nucleotidyltransferase domain